MVFANCHSSHRFDYPHCSFDGLGECKILRIIQY